VDPEPFFDPVYYGVTVPDPYRYFEGVGSIYIFALIVLAGIPSAAE
jgi:hypothetical protein